jgi:hypothetical protein
VRSDEHEHSFNNFYVILLKDVEKCDYVCLSGKYVWIICLEGSLEYASVEKGSKQQKHEWE